MAVGRDIAEMPPTLRLAVAFGAGLRELSQILNPKRSQMAVPSAAGATGPLDRMLMLAKLAGAQPPLGPPGMTPSLLGGPMAEVIPGGPTGGPPGLPGLPGPISPGAGGSLGPAPMASMGPLGPAGPPPIPPALMMALQRHLASAAGIV
jgi:hypothetical protein